MLPGCGGPGGGAGALATAGGGGVGFGAGCATVFCRTKLGSDFGSRVVIPVGPLSDTWFSPMLSRCHSLMVSPSARASGLLPGTAKMATRCSGSMTIPLSLRFGSCGSEDLSPVGRSGGRRVSLNNGWARVVCTNSSARGRCAAGAAGTLVRAVLGGAVDWSAVSPNSTNSRAAKIALPARQATMTRSITAQRQR